MYVYKVDERKEIVMQGEKVVKVELESQLLTSTPHPTAEIEK
jgi:hypothetical protein